MNSVREAKLTDREKVVEKLQAIDAYFRESFNAMDGGTLACELFREWSNAAEDAIALLKAQEPVGPVVDIDTWKCGNCGHALEHQQLLGDNVLLHEQYNYCPECGRAVKWE